MPLFTITVDGVPSTVDAYDVDHAQWLQRRAEDALREARKAQGETRPILYADSDDPTTGLQPAIGSHDAWESAGRIAPSTPHCTGCGAELDPLYCDPGARARAADYDAAQRAAVTEGARLDEKCPVDGSPMYIILRAHHCDGKA